MPTRGSGKISEQDIIWGIKSEEKEKERQNSSGKRGEKPFPAGKWAREPGNGPKAKQHDQKIDEDVYPQCVSAQ